MHLVSEIIVTDDTLAKRVSIEGFEGQQIWSEHFSWTKISSATSEMSDWKSSLSVLVSHGNVSLESMIFSISLQSFPVCFLSMSLITSWQASTNCVGPAGHLQNIIFATNVVLESFKTKPLNYERKITYAPA